MQKLDSGSTSGMTGVWQGHPEVAKQYQNDEASNGIMDISMEHVILVNENDQVIGLEEKLKAHQLGLLHRAFSVFLFRNDGTEVLMQQRSLQKYHCGGLWTNTCCSHPRENESTLSAAKRRLFEELNIQTELKQVGHFIYRAELSNGLIEHELDYVFVGEYNGPVDQFNREEIAQVRWMSLTELESDMQAQPQHYTPWLKQALATALTTISR